MSGEDTPRPRPPPRPACHALIQYRGPLQEYLDPEKELHPRTLMYDA
jgi:hypothetical protein